MPDQSLQVLQFRPGVNREGTNYSSEGGYYECDKVRFRSGLPEKIGGYVTYGDGEFSGVCRHYIEWASLSNYLLIGVGTNNGYYILTGGQYFDITPIDSVNATGPFYFGTLAGKLAGAINASDTVIAVDGLYNFNLIFPFVIRIGTELIYVPTFDPDNYTLGTANSGCIRGYQDTTAASHSSGATVESSWIYVRDAKQGLFAGDKVELANFYPEIGLGTENDNILICENNSVLVPEYNTVVYGLSEADLNTTFVVKTSITNYLGWNIFAVDTGVYYDTAVAVGPVSGAIVNYMVPAGLYYQGYQSGWGAGPWGGYPTYAVNLLPGTEYEIASLGPIDDQTDFTALGAANNNIGTIFTATGHSIGVGDYGVACETVSFRTDGAVVSRTWNEAFSSTAPQLQFRLWSAGNYGQDLYFNARNSSIYFWSANSNLSSSGKVTGRGVNILENTTQTSAASIAPDAVVVGNYYCLAYKGTTNWVSDGASNNYPGNAFFCTDVTASGTGWVVDLATPAMAVCLIVTDERHIVAFGCNDSVTACNTPILTKNMVAGATYKILDPGNSSPYITDYTAYGAPNNIPGTVFTATGSADPLDISTVAEVVQDTMYIAWCSQEQPKTWWPTVTNTAGNYRLTVGTRIITAVQTRQEVLVFTDMAVYSMQYLGAPYVFGFNLIDQNATIASPNAHATANNITFWMGQDKFYVYAGRIETLPCSLRQYVFDDINGDQLEQVYAGTNEKYNEIWWFYPSSTAQVNDRYVVYNYLDKVWYYGQLPRTAWLDSYAIGYPIGAKPILTDELNPMGLTAQHETGADDGTENPAQPISAYIKTSDFDLGQGGYQFSFVKRLIPDVDFIGSTTANPSVNFTLAARNYPGIGVNTDAMQSTTSATDGTKIDVQVYNYTNQAWVRLRGRQVSMTVSSDSLGVRWQLGNPRIAIQPDGRR